MMKTLQEIIKIIKPLPNMTFEFASGIIHLPKTEEQANELLEWLKYHEKNNTMPRRDIILEEALKIAGVEG